MKTVKEIKPEILKYLKNQKYGASVVCDMKKGIDADTDMIFNACTQLCKNEKGLVALNNEIPLLSKFGLNK